MAVRLLSMRRVCIAGLVLLSGCQKTHEVSWNEEVPLNERDVIWVRRTDYFGSQGEPGNPFHLVPALQRRRYDFEWNRQAYSYERDIRSSPGVFMIYVDEGTSTVHIVDYAKTCRQPGFAQFDWKMGRWQLAANVTPALLGRKRNLMEYSSATGSISKTLFLNAKRDLHLDSPRKRQAVNDLTPAVVAKDCSSLAE